MSKNKTTLAVAAHPDDIEFMMAGTMFLLNDAGYSLHYMTVANGSCGSLAMNAKQTARVRTQEAMAAAKFMGAEYHPPLVDDIQIYYEPSLAAKLCATVRKVNPEIVLIPAPQDYMEDHTNTCRLMVTAAFCRNMPNFPTDPPTESVQSRMALYHCMPHGGLDSMRNAVVPDFYIDISSVMDKKRSALELHRSQKEWLDKTQGMNSYIKAMEGFSAKTGKMSKRFEYAEGWRRHSHFGFAEEKFDPLREALALFS